MLYTQKMNKYLANLFVFYVKQHNLHWFIKGNNFFELHAKFEELYNQTAEHLDEVAERLLQLKVLPVASLKQALDLADIEELDSKHIDCKTAVEILVKDYKKLIADVKEISKLANEAGDEGTSDQFVGYLKDHEKTVWLLESYLG